MPGEGRDDGVLVDFLLEFMEDRQQGRLQSLMHYVSRFPGSEEAVARHYLELIDQPGESGDEAAEGTDGTRRIGSYLLLRELGRGGQGIVFLARDERLGRQVALKLLNTVAGDDVLLRFRREAELASKLDHPAICTVYEAGRVGATEFIAMRHVQGRSLRELIKQTGPEKLADAAHVRDTLERIITVAEALHLAHEAGIVHRDIKSSNIMVGDDGEPVILDFGLARDASGEGAALTLTGDLFGTPAYMSPEQHGGTLHRLDRRSDVWSLGVVLFECLAGHLPFEGPTIQSVVNLVLTWDAPGLRGLNRSVGRDLEVVVATALERDLARRYQSAGEFAADLRRILDHRPILARPAGPLLRTQRLMQRHPAVTLSSVVILLALVAVLWFLQQRDQAVEQMRRLSDDELARRLLEEERDELWPVSPGLVGSCDQWLARVDTLLSRRSAHEATRSRLLGRRLDAGGYADDRDQVLEDRLSGMLEALDRLAEVRPAIEQRRERSRSIERRSLEFYRDEWRECIEAIAAAPLYDGLLLEPQVGLVPLRENTAGLWEFWVVESGAQPQQDEDGEAYRLDRDSGLVLILVPGGSFHMGAHPALGPNIDPNTQQNEVPVVEVSLAPYFLSRYELTQGQWFRLMDGINPSQYPPGHLLDGRPIADWTSPVENVDWFESCRVARRLGMLLPTEAQWERACRAGTHSVWSFGDALDEVATHANFRGSESNGYYGQSPPVTGYADPHIRHAPVGSYRANPFGFHDLHGNVMEWCRDGYALPSVSLAGDEGLRTEPEDEHYKVIRGGNCTYVAFFGRSAARSKQRDDVIGFDLGVRLARRVKGVD